MKAMDAKSFIIGIFVAAISKGSMLSTAAEAVRMPEPAFYASLSEAADRLGIKLYVFSAATSAVDEHGLTCFRYMQQHWVRMREPLPDIVYDRCFFTSRAERQTAAAVLEKICQYKKHIVLSGNLPSKLTVYEALSKDSRIAAYLPATDRFQSALQVQELLHRHSQGVVIKPSSGMQGKGIVRLRKLLLHSGYSAQGRTIRNKPFAKYFPTEHALIRWIEAYKNRTQLLLQPYLSLTNAEDTPFDIRVLLQKDAAGQWRHTGSAARIGQNGSLTSNLHGGGSAVQAINWLIHSFGKAEAERLLSKLHIISHYTAEKLENSFGRFAELAFDFGLEPDGRVWLLEVNSKPGRTAFRLNGDQQAKQLSIERPLLYARLLSRRLPPSSITNEIANGRPLLIKKEQHTRPLNVQEVHQ